MAKKAEKTKVDELIKERVVPKIKTAHVCVNQEGFAFKQVVVRLPEGIEFSDLNEHPESWMAVQGDKTGKALCDDDELIIHGQGWTATAFVNHARHDRVVLYGLKQHTRQERAAPLLPIRSMRSGARLMAGIATGARTITCAWRRPGGTHLRVRNTP